MSMDFTAKDAKHLIAQHKALLENLEKIAARAESMRQNVRREANNPAMYLALKRDVVGVCEGKQDIDSLVPAAERLVHNLHKYQAVLQTVETADALRSYDAEELRRNIKLLNPGLAGLSWFFGGKSAKEKAVLAYDELAAMLGGNYGQMIPYLVSQMDMADKLSSESAWESLSAVPADQYRSFSLPA